MTRSHALRAAVVCIVLLVACAPGAPGPTGPTGAQRAEGENPCRYAPILIDFDGLPKPIVGPGEPAPSTLSATVPVGPFPPVDFQNPPEAVSTGTRPGAQGQVIKEFDPLVMTYTDPAQTAIAGCPVHLRTFGGQLVGPTLRVKPGETLAFSYDNTLAGEAAAHGTATHGDDAVATPNLDVTNLHTHGLHVFPGMDAQDREPASDNVLLRNPPPPDPQPYEIAIPPDHPPGTFWYHTHAHGSTAVQVSGGMAGAIIVEDDPATLPPALRGIKEQVMVFQSIFYGQDGEIAQLAGAPGNAWQTSLRRITINGQLMPKITMRPGEVQRWRMIGSMFKETLHVQLGGHKLHEIALDSLYLPRVDTWDEDEFVDLLAGYRSDVLVQASTNPGTYLLVDGETPADQAKDNIAEDLSIVGVVVVEGEPVQMALPTDAEMRAIAFQPDVDLAAEWAQLPPAQQAERTQEVIFDIGPIQTGAKPPIPNTLPPPSEEPSEEPPNEPDSYMINGAVFGTPASGERELQLGQVDRWLVTSAVGQHVFHIHVNPFQVIRAGPGGEPERVWKDTFLILGSSMAQPPYPQPHQPNLPPVTLYTRYDTKYVESAPYDPALPPFYDFAGRYVIHCHFLDHEDAGMMQIIHLNVSGGAPSG